MPPAAPSRTHPPTQIKLPSMPSAVEQKNSAKKGRKAARNKQEIAKQKQKQKQDVRHQGNSIGMLAVYKKNEAKALTLAATKSRTCAKRAPRRTTASLLGIPRWLRLKVFSYITSNTTLGFPGIESLFGTQRNLPFAPSLALVNKKVHAEFTTLLYGDGGVFEFGSEERAVRWAFNIGAQNKALLKTQAGRVVIRRPEQQKKVWEIWMKEALGEGVWKYTNQENMPI